MRQLCARITHTAQSFRSLNVDVQLRNCASQINAPALISRPNNNRLLHAYYLYTVSNNRIATYHLHHQQLYRRISMGSITDNHADMSKRTDPDGKFRRPDSKFRSFISSEPGAQFPPEKDRYVLYLNLGCPWAHRANIVRSLKGLEDIIQMVIMDYTMGPEGWIYNPERSGTDPKDPIYG